MNIDLIVSFVILAFASWQLGYNSGSRQWKDKFSKLSEYSLALIALLEANADEYNQKQKQDTQHDTQ